MDLHLFDLNLLVALDALLTERNVTRSRRFLTAVPRGRTREIMHNAADLAASVLLRRCESSP